MFSALLVETWIPCLVPQVGSDGYKKSAAYLVEYLTGIKEHIAQNRLDLLAEVRRSG
jgi:hypothetical protein